MRGDVVDGGESCVCVGGRRVSFPSGSWVALGADRDAVVQAVRRGGLGDFRVADLTRGARAERAVESVS